VSLASEGGQEAEPLTPAPGRWLGRVTTDPTVKLTGVYGVAGTFHEESTGRTSATIKIPQAWLSPRVTGSDQRRDGCRRVYSIEPAGRLPDRGDAQCTQKVDEVIIRTSG
jgi:hypothetical protein